MATAAVALSLVLGGCGSSSNTMEDPPPPEPMPDPMPVDVSMPLELSSLAQSRLKAVPGLTEAGDSTTVMIPAGGMVTRAAVSGVHGGVDLSCESMYDCTVTIMNSAGTITATWESMMLPDGDTPMVMASAFAPADTFARLNAGDVDAIRSELNPDDKTAATAAPNWRPTALIGMGIGGPGVLNADKAGLRSVLNPNGGTFVDAAGAVRDPQPTAGATGGEAPAGAAATATVGLRGGSTITGAMDAIDPSDDMASAPDGWGMKTLFRDWGDTAGTGDGGYETGAIVVKNLGEGTPYPFDRKLAGKYINDAAKAMFDFSILAGGTEAVDSLATSVDITSLDTADNTAMTTQWEAMVFDNDSLVAAQDQDLEVNATETFTGTYFGAPGKFRCISDADTGSCGLKRNADGTAVLVADSDSTMMGIQGDGRWSFTPDPGAMITVPDQDWMAYGAWLTTPDADAGEHRFGVFFNGMDPYEPAAMSLVVADDAGLRGTATYSGGATGVYVDGDNSGLFTARAMLTANFDANSNGDANTNDYSIAGRIDNFRGTDGVFLGDDTQESRNDPIAGGENDWVVTLGREQLDGTDTDIQAGRVNGTTSGSADGVAWTGTWNGQLFGPSTDADGVAIPPSGVAGRFWANTALDTATDSTTPTADAAVTSVVGAFGATKDD